MEKVPQTFKNISLFFIPSSIGICAFLIPFRLRGEMNTVIGHAKEHLMVTFQNDLSIIVVSLCFSVVILSVMALSLRPPWIVKSHILSENLLGAPVWFVSRICSLPIAMIVLWGEPETFGGFLKYAEIIVVNLAPKLIMLTIVLSLTAPLLLDFGFVQFVAVYASPVMRPLFKVPGRSAVDCIASWLGSSSMAVVLTAKMHCCGYYSDREAAVMVTSFSVIGIYNIYAITMLMCMRHVFSQILISVYFTMFLLALILPRIWPLNKITDTYHKGMDSYNLPTDDVRHGHTLFEWALIRGVSKARHMNIRIYLRESLSIAMPLLFSTIPLMITVGTFFIMIADQTPIMRAAATPLSWLLDLNGIPEAEGVGTSAVFAFVDQYLAAAYGQVLLTEAGRFMCICLTTVGLINLTEVGIHLWHTTIPIRFWHLAVIYLMRITMSLFILIPITYLFFL